MELKDSVLEKMAALEMKNKNWKEKHGRNYPFFVSLMETYNNILLTIQK